MSAPSRPKRLWVVAVMNIVVALLSLAAVLVVFQNSKLPAGQLIGTSGIVISAVIAVTVIVSSILALVGYPQARWLALGSALVFFGILLIQTVLLMVHLGPSLPPQANAKLAGGVVRNSLEIALNLWVFLSAKTATFFDARGRGTRAP